MLVFFSWSGSRSKAIAEVLSSWLGQVIQAADPWLSQDISKGTRWSSEVSSRLEKSRVGVVCLTPDNVHADWILFEAGALSKTKDAQVCTFLTDLKPTAVEDPLAQFQHTQNDKTDVKRLVETVNEAVAKAGEKSLASSTLNDVFETYWPRLEAALKQIPASKGSSEQPFRSDREILEEILEVVRRQARPQNVNSIVDAMFSKASTSSILDSGHKPMDLGDLLRSVSIKSKVNSD